MKYGQKLVEQSVPKWSLHNVDYNSLKHEIKVHTTRDQARAIAIPGHEDKRLSRFESRLYGELCSQHQRVGLFVLAKSGELERKLESTQKAIQRIIIDANDADGITPRRQRKLIKHERTLLEIGADIAALDRFVSAQVEAFRKILKKYRKWTGSTELGSRFRQKILRSENSFTSLRFDGLRARYATILQELRDAIGLDSEDSSAPISPVQQSPRSARQARFDPDPVTYRISPSDHCPKRYWNEYDDGSDCGNDDDYVIYITPEDDDDWTLPGLAHLCSILTLPYERVRDWFSGRHAQDDPNERRHLLSSPGHATDTDYGSDDNAPSSSSSVYGITNTLYGTAWLDRQHEHHQRRRNELRSRQNVISWASRGSFVAALVLLVIEVLMLGTGRPEVDLAIAVAAVASLCFAGVGLWARGLWVRARVGDDEEEALFGRAASPKGRLMAAVVFGVAVLLNGFVLAIVGRNWASELWGAL